MRYKKGEKFHRGRDHPFLKAMALFVAITFVESTVIWAAPPIPVAVEPVQKPVPVPSQIHIPEEFGVVEEVYQSPNPAGDSPLVIYIQDAHCIYEAQSNIRKIIDRVQKDQDLKLVALEGGEGKVNPALFRAFPVQEVKEKIIDGYVRRGELSGAEFAAIANDRESDFYGIEDMKIYFENKKAFLKAIDEKKRVDMKLDDIDRWLRKMKDETYSPELKELFQKTEDYEKEHLNLLDYVKYLKSFEGVAGHYPMIDALLAAVEREKAFDFKKIDAEAVTLGRDIERTMKASNGEELKEFRDKESAFKRGEMKRESYYLWLLGKAKDLGMAEGDEKLPELNGYMHHVADMEKIKGEELFKEIDALTAAIKEKLFQNDQQRKLDQFFHRLKILRNFSKLELSREELAEYREHQADFAEKNFWEFIGREVGQMELDDLFKPHRAFYDAALERDETLHKNLMKLLNEQSRKFAMVITGGFHSNGIKEMLKRDGISYILIVPRITQFDEKTPYWDVMRGKVSYAKWLKKETLSPELFLIEHQKAADQGLSTEFAEAVKENLPQILQGWKNAINTQTSISSEQKAEYTAIINEIFSKLITGKEAIPAAAAANITAQMAKILQSFFDGKRNEALQKIAALEKQIDQTVSTKQAEFAVTGRLPGAQAVMGRSLGAATAEELDEEINDLKKSKGLNFIRKFSEGDAGIAFFLKRSGMDAARVNADLFRRRLNLILETASPTKLEEYVSKTEALSQLMSDLSVRNFSKRKKDIKRQIEFLRFHYLTVERDYTDGDTVSQAVFEKAINYLMKPETTSIELAMITLPIASANKIGGVEMGSALKNEMMEVIKKCTAPDGVRALPLLQDAAGTSQGYIGTRLIALGLSKKDLEKILTEGFAQVKEKLKTRFLLDEEKTARLEEAFSVFGATSVIRGPSKDEKLAFKNEKNPEVRNKLGKQMVENLEGEVVRQLKTVTARAEVQEKILKQQGVFDEAQLDKPPPGLVNALREAEAKYIPQNDYFTGRLPRPAHDLGRVKIVLDGVAGVREKMGFVDKINAIANAIDDYHQAPTPKKLQALQARINAFKSDYAEFQPIFDHTVLRSLQDIRYSRSYKLSSFGKLIQAEADGSLDRLSARLKLDSNSFAKGIYMTKLGDEIGLAYYVNGKLTMSFLEFNKYNAFNDEYAPDARDSFYHNILQSLHALALEHGVDKGLTTEQNAKFLEAAQAAILNTQVEFTDEVYAGGFPLRAKDGSPIFATVERFNPETGKTEVIKTDKIQQGDKAKIKDLPFHFTEKIDGKRIPLYEDSRTGELFAVMDIKNPNETVFDARGEKAGILKDLGLNLTPVVGVTGATATADTRRRLFDENGVLRDPKKHFEWLGDMNGKQKLIPELRKTVAEAED
ncbi:MAG: hypothetical protein HZC17_08545, partial [Candidatus Omnitrophica bacterium]|nr:hypothetical protein [Candidatus Omnitrophota bacterium]